VKKGPMVRQKTYKEKKKKIVNITVPTKGKLCLELGKGYQNNLNFISKHNSVFQIFNLL
jgi:hypothetical protein